jgi:hypothetical protein
MFSANGQKLDIWAPVIRRFQAIGLGFLPRGVIQAIFISLAIVIIIPLALVALAAAVVVIALLIILWLALNLLKLPFRILGMLLGVGRKSSAQQEDDGRRNVRVIQRSDNPL